MQDINSTQSMKYCWQLLQAQTLQMINPRKSKVNGKTMVSLTATTALDLGKFHNTVPAVSRWAFSTLCAWWHTQDVSHLCSFSSQAENEQKHFTM